MADRSLIVPRTIRTISMKALVVDWYWLGHNIFSAGGLEPSNVPRGPSSQKTRQVAILRHTRGDLALRHTRI